MTGVSSCCIESAKDHVLRLTNYVRASISSTGIGRTAPFAQTTFFFINHTGVLALCFTMANVRLMRIQEWAVSLCEASMNVVRCPRRAACMTIPCMRSVSLQTVCRACFIRVRYNKTPCQCDHDIADDESGSDGELRHEQGEVAGLRRGFMCCGRRQCTMKFGYC